MMVFVIPKTGVLNLNSVNKNLECIIIQIKAIG